MVDIFGFDGSFIQNFRVVVLYYFYSFYKEIIGDNPVYLMINKMDLLPRTTSLPRLERWIYGQCKQRGLEIEGLYFVSRYKATGIIKFIESFLTNKKVN